MNSVTKLHEDLVSEERVITLYEICKVLGKEHNKAVKMVQELHKLGEFGTVEKIATVYNNKGQTIETFSYTKKQALMIGARLDSRNIIKLVNKLEELTEQVKVPTSPMEALELMFKVQKDINDRLSKLEATKRLEGWQEKSLIDAKNQKVYEIAKDDKELATKLHRKVWSLFKKQFHLPRYNELPALKFDDGVAYIKNLTLADML